VLVALVFAVLDLTGSAADLGIVLAAQSLPLAALVLVGGVWADRLPRQRVMLLSDLVRMLRRVRLPRCCSPASADLGDRRTTGALRSRVRLLPAGVVAVVPQTVDAHDLQPANALIKPHR